MVKKIGNYSYKDNLNNKSIYVRLKERKSSLNFLVVFL